MQAGSQLQLLADLAADLPVPHTLALACGDCAEWIEGCLGLPPLAVYRSVRFALETALLTAVAAARGVSLAALLCAAVPEGGTAAEYEAFVPVNGLLPGSGTAEEVSEGCNSNSDMIHRFEQLEELWVLCVYVEVVTYYFLHFNSALLYRKES